MIEWLFTPLPPWGVVLYVGYTLLGASVSLSNAMGSWHDLTARPSLPNKTLQLTARYAFAHDAAVAVGHLLHITLATFAPIPRVMNVLIYTTLFVLAMNGFHWRRTVAHSGRLKNIKITYLDQPE